MYLPVRFTPIDFSTNAAEQLIICYTKFVAVWYDKQCDQWISEVVQKTRESELLVMDGGVGCSTFASVLRCRG